MGVTELVLGVDPGQRGGAVLVRPGAAPLDVLGAWAWRPRTERRQAVWDATDATGAVLRVASLHAVAMTIAWQGAAHGAWWLCCEGLFVPPGRHNGVLTLAESAGEVIGPLRGLGVVARPRASDWRPAVLGLSPRTRADRASAVALARVAAVAGPLGALEGDEHVAEAACIAFYGAMEWGRRQRATMKTDQQRGR